MNDHDEHDDDASASASASSSSSSSSSSFFCHPPRYGFLASSCWLVASGQLALGTAGVVCFFAPYMLSVFSVGHVVARRRALHHLDKQVSTHTPDPVRQRVILGIAAAKEEEVVAPAGAKQQQQQQAAKNQKTTTGGE